MDNQQDAQQIRVWQDALAQQYDPEARMVIINGHGFMQEVFASDVSAEYVSMVNTRKQNTDLRAENDRLIDEKYVLQGKVDEIVDYLTELQDEAAGNGDTLSEAWQDIANIVGVTLTKKVDVQITYTVKATMEIPMDADIDDYEYGLSDIEIRGANEYEIDTWSISDVEAEEAR